MTSLVPFERLKGKICGCQWRIQDFPLAGRRPVGGGHQPPTCTLFGKNVCKNKRNGSCWGGGHAGSAPPGSANGCYGDGYYSYGFPIEILLFLQKCFDTYDNFVNPAFQPDADQWLEVMNC